MNLKYQAHIVVVLTPEYNSGLTNAHGRFSHCALEVFVLSWAPAKFFLFLTKSFESIFCRPRPQKLFPRELCFYSKKTSKKFSRFINFARNFDYHFYFIRKSIKSDDTRVAFKLLLELKFILSPVRMLISILSITFFVQVASCIIYINRVEIETNPAIGALIVNYTHDSKGNSIANATFTTFVTITKTLIYFKIKLAENEDDKKFKRLLISSVVDVDKVLQGFQSNMLISKFFAAFRTGMNANFKHPLPPVII